MLPLATAMESDVLLIAVTWLTLIHSTISCGNVANQNREEAAGDFVVRYYLLRGL